MPIKSASDVHFCIFSSNNESKSKICCSKSRIIINIVNNPLLMFENFLILLSTVLLVSWIRGTSEGTAGGGVGIGVNFKVLNNISAVVTVLLINPKDIVKVSTTL